MSTTSHQSVIANASDAKPEPISLERVLAVLLILLQLAMVAYLSEARAFPIMVACLVLWGLVTRLRLRVEPMPLNLLYAMMAIGFLLHYMFVPYPLPLDSQFIRSSLAHSLARLLICVQAMQLFLHHPSGRLPIWIAGCGAVTLSFATNLRVPVFMHRNLLLPVAAFMGIFALYGGAARRTTVQCRRVGGLRTTIMLLAVVGAMSLGSGASWGLQKHERDIEGFLSDYLGGGGQTTRTGFTPNGRLQSVTAWKADGGEQVMLRVFSDKPPGYLRGKAFDIYQGSSRQTSYTAWVSTFSRRPAPEAGGGRPLPGIRPGDRVFQLSPDAPPPGRVLDVWPDEQSEAHFFAPLGTTAIAVSGTRVQIDNQENLTLQDRASAVPYLLFAGADAGSLTGTDPEPASDIDRELLTSLDGQIDPEVHALAEQLFANCRTSRDKIRAVEHYFLENYQYKQGINVPHLMDPITYFLIKQPAAHCEYFATGSAVLLRLGNVPCRYVVGYVAEEWNRIGGFWVARNKDAHAWVEAYDDATGEWRIVETTPSAGIPQARQLNLVSQLNESFRQRLSIWRMRLREYGTLSLIASFGRLIWSIPGLIVVLVGLTILLFRYQPKLIWRGPRERPPAHLKGMHHMLARLDRQTRQHGFERGPEETLSQFAERVRSSNSDARWKETMSRCYTLYVGLRYRGQSGTDAVQSLREAIARIPTTAVPRKSG